MEAIYYYIWYQHQSSFFLIFVKIENINMGETTLHILYPYITPQTPIFPWFVKFRPTYPDPSLFYDFRYDKLTHMKGWMVGLSYHWMLYLIFSGRGVLTYLQYDYPHPPFFNFFRKAKDPFLYKIGNKG